MSDQAIHASAYFVVAYLAISLPVVAQGFAAATFGLYAAGIILNGVVAGLSLLALASTVTAARHPVAYGGNGIGSDGV